MKKRKQMYIRDKERKTCTVFTCKRKRAIILKKANYNNIVRILLYILLFFFFLNIFLNKRDYALTKDYKRKSMFKLSFNLQI